MTGRVGLAGLRQQDLPLGTSWQLGSLFADLVSPRVESVLKG
jgi:hypothetical protein